MSNVAQTLSHVQRVRFLYKTILRLHRGLPVEFKAIGDQYVKDEFKRHKNCKPEEITPFMTGWLDYAVTLGKQLSVGQLIKGTPAIGRCLTQEELDCFRDEQIGQLYELMQETHKPYPSIEEST